MRKIGAFLIVLILFALAGAGAYLGFYLLEGVPPEVEILGGNQTVGRDFLLRIKVKDDRSGISTVQAKIIQGGKEVVVGFKTFGKAQWWQGSGVHHSSAAWRVEPLKLGLKEGRAVLMVEARDSSLRGGLKGNKGTYQRAVVIDTTAPRIALLSLVHNLAQGGAGLVTFKVSEPCSRVGLELDSSFFPAYPLEGVGGKGAMAALVAVPFDKSRLGRFVIEAVDKAGNKATMGVPHRLLRRKKVRDRINISDRFLQLKMPDFVSRYPELTGTPIQVFLKVNKEIRARNNKELLSHCVDSTRQILWKGPFMQLPRSQYRAGFADERHYFYKGKEVDQAYHMGVDLASVKHAPVPAANSGIVIFADYQGIYGNTVIIDHGLGLFSTYSHLNEILVKKGDRVTKGQVIGRTGMTGLAGGDHLHYAMVISGHFVNPMEWWDRRWIRDHILANLAAR